MTLLIDCDPVVYRCGFAAESRSYWLVFETEATGLAEECFTPSKDKSAGDWMKEWIKAMEEIPGFKMLDKTINVTPQPLAFALEATRMQMDSIVKETKAKDVRCFISGTKNYRYKLAKQRAYKGNRDDSVRPVHYTAIRKYLRYYWRAEDVDGIEADDKISILARTSPKPVIATIDKDLDQIPGKHYNYMKKVFYDVDEEEAELFFYQQCLSGDSTDNIPGCYKVGHVKAAKAVQEAWEEESTYENVWKRVIEEYRLSKEREGCPYLDQDIHSVALETARLVRLQEYDGQLWCPPGVADELITEELYAE